MKLLFLINKYPDVGGTEVVTTALANGFTAQGDNVHIASFKPNHSKAASLPDQRVKLHVLPQPAHSKSAADALGRIVREHEIDFIINQWCLPFYVTTLLRRATSGTRCQFLSVNHNPPNQNKILTDIDISLAKQPNPLVRLLLRGKRFAMSAIIQASMRYAYRHSARYVLLSEGFVPIFRDFTGLSETKKLTVIPNPLTIDTAGLAADPANKDASILYVGRIDHHQKRVERLLMIWERIYDRLPDWRLDIVGDGPERARLETWVSEKALPRVRFHGFADPSTYLSRAAMLLLTSEYEGFGLVILEAMAFGAVPVVYGSYAAVYDIINNGADGYIMPPPFSTESFCDKVTTLAENKSLRIDLGNAAITAVNRYERSHIISRWNQLFTELRQTGDDPFSINQLNP